MSILQAQLCAVSEGVRRETLFIAEQTQAKQAMYLASTFATLIIVALALRNGQRFRSLAVFSAWLNNFHMLHTRLPPEAPLEQ